MWKRVAKTSAAYEIFHTNDWECSGFNVTRELKVYTAVVLTAMLYISETWTTYTRHAKQLSLVHLRCLHRLLHIIWQYRTTDREVLRLACISRIHILLRLLARVLNMSSICLTVAYRSNSGVESCARTSVQLEREKRATKQLQSHH